MPSVHIQLVKWSFPAFALIIGLLWYKRRRVDRGDPGGSTETLTIEPASSSATSRASPTQKNESSAQPKGTTLSLYDSGIHIDESFAASNSSSAAYTRQDGQRKETKEEIANNLRKVSLSLDIPTRKPASEPISMSITSSELNNDRSSSWYAVDEDETMSKMIEIELGSNPRANTFETMARSLTRSSIDATKMDDEKALKIFKDVNEATEDDQRQENDDRQQEQDNTCEEKKAQFSVTDAQVECGEYAKNGGSGGGEPVEDSSEDGAKVQVLSERDSANHSPVSGVLEGSVTDEARSEGSTDSGKGGSIKGHMKDTAATPEIYQFSIPQDMVGRLIGRHGRFLQSIRTKANGEVHIIINHHPTSRNQKVCWIEGTREGINIALDMIRHKFPENKYPHLTFDRIPAPVLPEEIPWVTELMQLSLVEGVSNDVVVCHIMKPNRLFVQIPTHPTYPFLRILDANITQLYNTTDSPLVPDQLNKGMILVANWYNKWVRVYVESPDPLGEQHLVRLVDHGGYWTFSNAEMRKIRADYLTLPFQAIEIFLANIQPVDGEWKQEAYDVVVQMCSGVVGQAQIEGYIDMHTYVNLYLNIQKHGVISLADELIARGFAEPIPLEGLVPEDVVSMTVQACI